MAVRFQKRCNGMVEPNDAHAPRIDYKISGLRRTIWDGSTELGEIQAPESALGDNYA